VSDTKRLREDIGFWQMDRIMTESKKLNHDCIVQRASDIIDAETDQELVMVSIANGVYYGVSDVARDIWKAVEQPKRISDLIDELAATYNIDRGSCEEQTLEFLDGLLTEGLLQVRDAALPS
jgi:hypothetical protein